MTIRAWIGVSLLLAATAGSLTYWKVTSRMQVRTQVQITQPSAPPLDEATQKLLDEARQPLDISGEPKGKILRLQ
jgi:hypothetical protein